MTDTFQIGVYTIITSLINDKINIDITDQLNKKYESKIDIETTKYHLLVPLNEFYEIIKNV